MTYFERISDPILLISFAVLCALSFFLSFFLIIVARYFLNLRGQQDLYAIQSAHDIVVPRLGGFAVFLTVLLFLWALNSKFLEPISSTDFDIGPIKYLLITASPIFFVGLFEDLGYPVSPMRRILASISSGALVIWLFRVWINGLGIPILDNFISISLIGIIFTLIASSGVVNAFNLIDGLNGLSSFTGISTAVALSYVAYEINQIEILKFLFIFSAIILGFLLLNFPAGKIFLGDAGAYMIGHLLVWSAIILVNHSQEVSPFAILLIFFWPVADTLLAIWRRWRQKRRTYQPDRLHFHQLVMRFLEIKFFGRSQRRLSNPIATIILVPFISFPQVLGVMFWNDFTMSVGLVIIMTILFFSSYVLGISAVKKFR